MDEQPSTSHNGSEGTKTYTECPICLRSVPKHTIEVHVNRCIFLNDESPSSSSSNSHTISTVSTKKRTFEIFDSPIIHPKKLKLTTGTFTTEPFKNRAQRNGNPKVIDLAIEEEDEDLEIIDVNITIFFIIFRASLTVITPIK